MNTEIFVFIFLLSVLGTVIRISILITRVFRIGISSLKDIIYSYFTMIVAKIDIFTSTIIGATTGIIIYSVLGSYYLIKGPEILVSYIFPLFLSFLASPIKWKQEEFYEAIIYEIEKHMANKAKLFPSTQDLNRVFALAKHKIAEKRGQSIYLIERDINKKRRLLLSCISEKVIRDYLENDTLAWSGDERRKEKLDRRLIQEEKKYERRKENYGRREYDLKEEAY